MINIFVDADACPVKQEISRVARRHGLTVTLVTNSRMRIPQESHLDWVVVDGQFDSADSIIATSAAPPDPPTTTSIHRSRTWDHYLRGPPSALAYGPIGCRSRLGH
jgi:hypothetical protein